MSTTQQDSITSNAVAYNRPLRDQLQSIHEMLSEEITSIAAQAIEPTKRLSQQTETALFAMSEGASHLTLALIKARESKKHLNEEEEITYKRIKEVAGTLGNLQIKANNLLKITKQINALNIQLKETAISLLEDIMTSQECFREIRANINDLGHLSKDPSLAHYLSLESKNKNQ